MDARAHRYDFAMTRPAEQLADSLRDHGLRATTTRVAVLRAVSDLSGHPDTDTIATRVRQREREQWEPDHRDRKRLG